MTINTQRDPVCKSEWKTLRRAVRADLPELGRLFCAMQAEAGNLSDVAISKMNAAFERAIAKDGMIVVAPGLGGRLNGFLYFAHVEQWFSDVPRLAEVCLCADRGHLRSKSARELRRFSFWARKSESERAAGDAAVKSSSAPQAQECAVEVPRAVASGHEKIGPDVKPAQGNPSNAVEPLARLAPESSKHEQL